MNDRDKALEQEKIYSEALGSENKKNQNGFRASTQTILYNKIFTCKEGTKRLNCNSQVRAEGSKTIRQRSAPMCGHPSAVHAPAFPSLLPSRSPGAHWEHTLSTGCEEMVFRWLATQSIPFAYKNK